MTNQPSSNRHTPVIALVAIARPTFDVPLAQSVADTALASLQGAGYTVVGTGAELLMDAEGAERAVAALTDLPFDLLILLQASFADSTMAVRIIEGTRAAGAPLLLWAIPEERSGERLRLNSLCGIDLTGHALTRRRLSYDYLLAAANDPRAVERIGVLARAGVARRTLKEARIGLVGQHPAGFDTCAYDASELNAIFGATIIQIPLDRALGNARSIGSEPRDAFVERIGAYAGNLADLDSTAVRGTAGVYAALRAFADTERLDGIAVRCWPEFFTELGCAACGAMSVLNEDMVPTSCEADVNGTLTLVMLQALSSAPVFIADLVSVDTASDTVVLWHCGLAPVSMADPESPICGTIHTNRKLPLLLEFPLRPGRITLARLSQTRPEAGRAGYRLVIGGGEMVRAPRSFSGTCGVVRCDRPAQEVLDIVMREGLEHHVCLVYGDYRAELHALATLVGLEVVELTRT
jgi:L-fucose isomerase-like protein